MLAPFARHAAPPRVETQSNCFVCGPTHPTGLRLQFEASVEGVSQARWVPEPAWEGFRGIVHGGIVSTVLDEAMWKAVSAGAYQALTAELRVRFHRPVQPGQEYVIRGWIVEYAKRRVRTEAAVIGADGEESAHAWGTFLPVAAER